MCEDKEFTLESDTLLYYPSGVSYFLKSESDDPMQFITVNFDFTDEYEQKELLCPVYVENYNPNLLQASHEHIEEPRFLSAFTINHAGKFLTYLVKMNEIKENVGAYSEELCSSLLRSLILEMVYTSNQTMPNNKIVMDAMTYIRNNFGAPLTNHSVAASLKYHPYYLGALFREHLGKTIREYIDEVRLSRAAQLLSHTDDSIFEIAACCGYRTPEHFTRRFKIFYGHTPTGWRKRRNLI